MEHLKLFCPPLCLSSPTPAFDKTVEWHTNAGNYRWVDPNGEIYELRSGET